MSTTFLQAIQDALSEEMVADDRVIFQSAMLWTAAACGAGA